MGMTLTDKLTKARRIDIDNTQHQVSHRSEAKLSYMLGHSTCYIKAQAK